jgi:hypothetical protein
LNLRQHLLPGCHLSPPFSKLQWNKHEKLLHLFLFLLVFFLGLMFFGSGFEKSQLGNSVSNLGLSFSFLISFFCNRTWRCWRICNRTQKMLQMGDYVFFWVYSHVLFKVYNLATLFQLLLINLSLCVLQIEFMRSCCIWDIVIQYE